MDIKDCLKRLFLSRKFLVFVVAIIFLAVGRISEDIFLYLMVAFLGANTVEKFKGIIIKKGGGK